MDSKKTDGNFLKQAFVTQTKGFADISQKKSLWSEFAEKTGGVFETKHTVANDLALFHLTIPLENGAIEFMESDTHPFKVICETDSDKQVEFTVNRHDIFSRFLKVFGPRGITLSHPDFDKQYFIKGRDESRVKNILKEEAVIRLILKTAVFSISCERDPKRSKQIITGMLGRSVKSMQGMQDAYDLFRALLDQISKI